MLTFFNLFLLVYSTLFMCETLVIYILFYQISIKFTLKK